MSCALSDGSSGKLLGTVGIPQLKNHTATGGPEYGEKQDLIIETGIIISPVSQYKRNKLQSFLHASKSLYTYTDFTNGLSHY